MSRNATIAALISVIPLTFFLIYLALAVTCAINGDPAFDVVVKPAVVMIAFPLMYLLQDGESRQELLDRLLVVFSMAGGAALVLSFGLAWLADWRVRKAIAFSADDKPQPPAEGYLLAHFGNREPFRHRQWNADVSSWPL